MTLLIFRLLLANAGLLRGLVDIFYIPIFYNPHFRIERQFERRRLLPIIKDKRRYVLLRFLLLRNIFFYFAGFSQIKRRGRILWTINTFLFGDIFGVDKSIVSRVRLFRKVSLLLFQDEFRLFDILSVCNYTCIIARSDLFGLLLVLLILIVFHLISSHNNFGLFDTVLSRNVISTLSAYLS